MFKILQASNLTFRHSIISKCNIKRIRCLELLLPFEYKSRFSALSREVLTVCLAVFWLHILWGPALIHSTVCISEIDRVIWSESKWREKKPSKRLHAHTAFVQKSILQPSCRSSACCSQWEQRRHLLSTSLLSSTRPPVCLCTLLLSLSSSALLFQLKPPRHAVGARVVRLLLRRWGWNVLCFTAPTSRYV